LKTGYKGGVKFIHNKNTTKKTMQKFNAASKSDDIREKAGVIAYLKSFIKTICSLQTGDMTAEHKNLIIILKDLKKAA
jgi:hypothetical protein